MKKALLLLTVIRELKPIEMISTCTTPALFHHTNKDQVVPPQHSRDLYKVFLPSQKISNSTNKGLSCRKGILGD